VTLYDAVMAAAKRAGFAGVTGKTRGINAALAAAVGLSQSALVRGLKDRRVSVETLLRLAEVTGQPPARFLELAGKGDTARLIERMFGPARAPLSAQDQTLIGYSADIKRQLIRLVDGLQRK